MSRALSSRHLAVVALAAACLLASAAAAAQDYLPPADQIAAALRAQPGVRAAAARVDAATATRRALAVGSHEYLLSSGAQNRRIDGEGDYREWEAQLSRAIRLPGKARLDRAIGDSTRDVADLRLADAEHQAARRVLETWMGWLRSAIGAEEATAQENLLEREKQALARRVALGDAARRDLDVIEAEYALLAAQAIAARDAAIIARQTLATEFPQLALPRRIPVLPDPQPLSGGAQAWRDRIVEQSAEIGIADGEANRLSLVAARTRADRRADPSVGVRLMSDRGGAERVVGVVVSVPFGGRYRDALAAAESANAVAAEADALDVRRQAEQAAWTFVQIADGKRQQWQSLQRALAAQDAASTRTRRAWELGEAPLSEHLLAQRSQRQARLAEAQARVDALEAALRVRVDAHALWHSGTAEDTVHGGH